jgi:prolipoprotein diacylglyceryltransferase
MNMGKFERIVSPEVRVWGKKCPSYLVCGVLGLIAGTLLSFGIVSGMGLSYLVMVQLIVGGLFTFFSITLIIKIVTGKESIVYYHHLIGVLGITAIQLYLLEIDILLYLDIMILGLGMFQAYGRIGCFLGGCCHGRPCKWGVSYGSLHEKEGLPSYYSGVRLFPIQLVESLWIFISVIVGLVLKLGNNEPGTALSWYIMAYGTGRFLFEFARGDTERKYLWGYSEAQWFSLVLMGTTMLLERSGMLPATVWHAAAPAALMLTMSGVFLIRHLKPMTDYRYPSTTFIDELAEQLRELDTAVQSQKQIRQLSGEPRLHISSDIITQGEKVIYLYTISSPTGRLTEKAAGNLTQLICLLQNPFGAVTMKKSIYNGIFHVLISDCRDTKGEPAK